MTDFPGMISRRVPYAERRRVFIVGHGYGREQEHVTLRGTLMGVGVRLDNGNYQMFSPCQITEPPLGGRTAEVIQFPVRLRVVEARS